LLHVYPLDFKTKEGNYFWSLPKRPPSPIDFDPTNLLHCRFIASYACLLATIHNIPIPSKEPRSDEFRKEVGLKASQVKVPFFVPSDDKAKEISQMVEKDA